MRVLTDPEPTGAIWAAFPVSLPMTISNLASSAASSESSETGKSSGDPLIQKQWPKVAQMLLAGLCVISAGATVLPMA